MQVKDFKVKSEPTNIIFALFFFILLVILLLLRNLHTLFLLYMYLCSFVGVEKYIYFGKVTSKVIQFLFKYVIISFEFHFKLMNNYFDLYEKSNENYI